jgi:hypothetical protein
VDSRPDALIHKARITIQIYLFGRLPIMVQTRAKQIWKLRVEDQPSGRPSPLVQSRKALYGNYLQRTCDRLDDSASPFERGSQTGKFFSENLKNFGRTVVRPNGLVHRPSGTRIFHCSHPFEPQPINRGPWALRTARIRY